MSVEPPDSTPTTATTAPTSRTPSPSPSPPHRKTTNPSTTTLPPSPPATHPLPSSTPRPTRIRNRRKRYLDQTPGYFSASLERAAPLLYDRLVRRFQSAEERRRENAAKGFAGVLEADLRRGEARVWEVRGRGPGEDGLGYGHGGAEWSGGESEEEGEGEGEGEGLTREEAHRRWREIMERRFMEGRDEEFEYETVDGSEEWDDWDEERRGWEEAYFGGEEPAWAVEEGRDLQGETGIQDF